jgi:hypothetical protein
VKTPPPDSDEDSELSPAELREAIMESTDMHMIDYSGEDALEILFSDPFFEILRTTRHTSLVLFSGGVHGVFFTSEVDVARAHHVTMSGLNPSATDVAHDRRVMVVSSALDAYNRTPQAVLGMRSPLDLVYGRELPGIDATRRLPDFPSTDDGS